MATELLVNPSFQQPVVANGSVTLQANGNVPGWTGQSGIGLEFWGSGAVIPDDPNGGTQKIEVDSGSIPYQTVAVPAAAATMRWSFDARQRPGTAFGVRMRLGDAANPLNTNAVMILAVASQTAWQTFSGTWDKPAGVTQVRIEFTAGPGAGGSNAGLDAVSLVIVDPIPCDCCPLTNYAGPFEFLGPELLGNGDMEQSTGTGASSSIGPIWQTDYTPCGPSLFAGPCTAGTYAFFTTNAGQVTNSSGNPLGAQGSRSMAVNVSGNLTADIIRWVNIPLVNGKKYRFSCLAGVIGFPFGVGVNVDGVVIGALPSPATAAVWTPTTLDFVWTGSTGNHTISVRSNNGTLGGNDHAFDNFSLKTVVGPVVPLNCNGTITWFDQAGSKVTFCPGSFTVPDLVMNAQGLDPMPLGGPPGGGGYEAYYGFSIFPTSLSAGVIVEPNGEIHTQNSSPVSNAGCPGPRQMQLGFPALTSLNFKYGPLSFPNSISNGSWLRFESSSLGGAITWPQNVTVLPGQSIQSNPLPGGVFAKLTNLGGPFQLSTNYPVTTNSVTCFAAGEAIRMHLGDNSTNDHPVYLLIEFFQNC